MAFHLLERNRDGALTLAHMLETAMEHVQRCNTCRILCEDDECTICANPGRDRSKICVVESPADVLALEQTALFRGIYFVLSGHLSPIDGIGPGDIGIDRLVERVAKEGISEVIMATNPTVEGEATAHYIADQIKDAAVVVTRIAHGVPLGGELEFVDGGTLAHALEGRRSLAG
jgi:recombination protein RecR